MPRFALRHKKRIESKLGVGHLNLLLSSLDNHFNSNVEIEELESDRKEYKMIQVPNTKTQSPDHFSFYIIAKKFDVYRLAYAGKKKFNLKT